MKQLQQLFGRWQNEDTDATQPSKPITHAPDSHIGATEHQIELQFGRGARVTTEISDITPTEIRSKFVIQGVGITGVGITPREKFTPVVQTVEIGDVVMQEVESWEYKDGQCIAALRLTSQPPIDAPENGPGQALEDDRVDSMQGG